MMPDWIIELGKQAPVLAIMTGLVIWLTSRFLQSIDEHRKSSVAYQEASMAHIDLVSGQCHKVQSQQAEAVASMAQSHRETSTMVSSELKDVAVALGQVVEGLRRLNGGR